MAFMSDSKRKNTAPSRLVIYGWLALALQSVALFIFIIRFYGLNDWSCPRVGADFAIFWSAARVTIEHGAASVFSVRWMQPLEEAVWHFKSFAPWPYPPTFLLLVLPFGFLPFPAALALYSISGIAAYRFVLSRIVRKVDRSLTPVLAAFPGVTVTIGMGQSSLITVAAAGAALALLETDAALAGGCIALLAIKPQFGVLFPVALACDRRWKALAAAAFASIAFVGISTVVLGRDAWIAFASFLPRFNRIVVEEGGRQIWTGMASTFAIARGIGFSVHAAYLTHAAIAICGVAAMLLLWVKPARFELRASALIIATLLVQPYVMFYDLIWLALPIAFLMRDANVASLRRVEWAILAAAWIAPPLGLLAMMVGMYLQIVPLVLLALLAILIRRHFVRPRTMRTKWRCINIAPCAYFMAVIGVQKNIRGKRRGQARPNTTDFTGGIER